MIYYRSELYHYGVKGTHWGVRNYQYEDGSYKPGAEGRYAPKGSGSGRRRGGGIHGINERYYSKRASKHGAHAQQLRTVASMNRNAKNQALKKNKKLAAKIYDLNERSYSKRANRLQKIADRYNTMASMNRAAIESKKQKKAAKKASKSSVKKKSASKKTSKVLTKSGSTKVSNISKRNSTMASMNRAAKNKALKDNKKMLAKIYEINENYYSRRSRKK